MATSKTSSFFILKGLLNKIILFFISWALWINYFTHGSQTWYIINDFLSDEQNHMYLNLKKKENIEKRDLKS